MQGMDVQGDEEEQDVEVDGVDAERQENALSAATKLFSAYRTEGYAAGLRASRNRLEPNVFASGRLNVHAQAADVRAGVHACRRRRGG